MDRLDEILKKGFQILLQMSGLYSGGVYFSDEKTGVLDLAYHQGFSSGFVTAVRHISPTDPIADIVRRGTPLVLCLEALQRIPLGAQILKEGLNCIAVFPILYKEQPLGCVNIALHSEKELSDETISAMQGIVGLLAISINRIKAELNLKESEEKFRTITEETVMGIAIIQDNIVKYVNEAMAKIIEYPVEEMLAWKSNEMFNIIHPEDRQMAIERTGRHTKGKKSEDPFYTYRFITKSGKVKWIDINTSNIHYEGRIGLLSSALDITERKLAEINLIKERDRAQSYLDIAGVMFVVVNKDQNVVLINKKGCDILEATEEDIIGKNWFDNFIPEHEKENVKRVFQQVMDGEDDLVKYYENPIITKTGEEKIIAWHNTIIRDEKGEVIATLSSGEDITDQRRAEIQLQESEMQMSAILDSMLDLVAYYTESDMKVEWVNKAAADSLELPPNSIVGRHCYELWNQSKQPCEFCPVTRAFNSGEPEEGENATLDGRFWRIRAYPVKGQNGEIRGVVEITRDITTQKNYLKQLENEVARKTTELQNEKNELQKALSDLQRAQERLIQSEKLASIGLLASGIAHEINNPLMGMINYAQIIRDELQEQRTVDINKKPFIFIDYLIKEGERISEIVKDLLTFAREDKGQYEYTDLKEVIQSAFVLLAPKMRTYQIDYELDVTKNLPKIPMRKRNIQQVLLNVIQNSIDALNEKFGETNEEGEKRIRIEASTIHENNKDYIEISIRDNGRGIPEQNLKNVFDPFFTTKDKSKEHGTGLGLSISYGIIQEHKGQISLDSKLGDYTRVRILLPTK
jgi:PAS domain S-box-containing protein